MKVAAGIYARILLSDAASKADPQLSEMQREMLDATPDCIKVISVDGALLAMNRAGCLALGVPEDSDFGMAWLPLLPDDVHLCGEAALKQAAAGHTARFPGRSVSPKGTIYWDNLLTPIIDASGQVLSILCVSRDVTEKTLLERRLEEAVYREKLLAREMRHRVKNLFSVVSSLISISMREAGSAENAIAILHEKLRALSRASDAVFAQENGEEGMSKPADLETVVTSVMQPYGSQCTVSGNPTLIRRDAITIFALFLHELATNSIKYGSLSKINGHVKVKWIGGNDFIKLIWTETDGPPILFPPENYGFGTEMIDRFARSIGGAIERSWRPEGLVVDLQVPT